MSNLPANRGQTTLANKPGNLPALGAGQALTLRPKTMEEAMRLADMIAKSSFCPKSFRDKNGNGIAGDILMVALKAEQLDIPLLQALAGIAVINGTPKIWGDLGPALILRSKQCEYFLDTWDEASQTAIVQIKRKGKVAREFTFSWADAVKANLAQKDTYRLYPKDMCTWKAKTRAMRTEFPDVLEGMEFVEDALGVDLPADAPEVPPIQMPREIAQATPAPEESKAKCSMGDPQPQGEDPVPIFVAKADEKQSAKGKTYFVVEFSDAVIANTFSETAFATACDACVNRKPVAYTSELGREYTGSDGVTRRGTNLKTIEIVGPSHAPQPAEPEAGGEPGK